MKSKETLSLDLRRRILKAYDEGRSTREQVAARFEVSLGMVKKLLQQRKRTGDIAPQHHRSGRKPKITSSHENQLRKLLKHKPDMTLEELHAALEVDCTLPAIHYTLKEMGLSYKKDAPRKRARPGRRGPSPAALAAAPEALRPGASRLPG